MAFDLAAFALDVAWIFAAALAATLAAYFGLGHVFLRLNARHPARRIQPDRDGLSRARAEQRESVRSITVTSLCLALAVAIQWHGLSLWPAPGGAGIVWTLTATAGLMLGYDFYYYWAHRLMHWGPFYRWHAWHHRSVAPTVWSSDSQSVPETFLIQSFMVWASLLAPIPPVAFALHRLYDHVNGQLGHAGFEYFADRSTRFPSPLVCTSYHDTHHARFRWNFGNYTSVWDRLFGTLHPDYDAMVAETEARAAKEGGR